jgi:uncharacterized membrane protein
MTRLRRVGHDQSGTVLVLILGLVVLAAALVVVVVDTSAVFLTRRSLVGAADAAALSGAQSIDERAIYTGQGAQSLPLDPGRVRQAVSEHVTATALSSRFADFRLVAVESDGRTVEVRLAARTRLPFPVPGAASRYVDVGATARARSPHIG